MIFESAHPIGFGCVEMLQRECEGCDSVLDLGSGFADVLRALRCPGRQLTGIEIWKPYLDAISETHADMKFINGDVRDALNLVPEKSFDMVISFDILEHLETEEAYKLVEDAEKIARKKIVLFVPVGVHQQGDEEWIERTPERVPNPFQRHKSVWYPKMLEDKNYIVWYWSEYHPPRPNRERGAMFCLKEFKGGVK